METKEIRNVLVNTCVFTQSDNVLFNRLSDEDLRTFEDVAKRIKHFRDSYRHARRKSEFLEKFAGKSQRLLLEFRTMLYQLNVTL